MKFTASVLLGTSLLFSQMLLAAEITRQQHADLINSYMQAAIENEVQREGDLLYEKAPTVDQIILDGVALVTAKEQMKQQLDSKQNTSINNSLYLTGMGDTPATSAIIDTHLSNYCSQSGLFPCSPEQDQDPATQHADLKISTLLANDSLNGSQQIAVDSLINMLTNPFPSTDLRNLISSGQDLTGYKEKKKIAKAFASAAIADVSAYMFTNMQAMRTRPELPGGTLGESFLEVINRKVDYYHGQDFADKIAGASDTALIREQLLQNALMAQLLWMNYQQAERNGAAMATMVSSISAFAGSVP